MIANYSYMRYSYKCSRRAAYHSVIRRMRSVRHEKGHEDLEVEAIEESDVVVGAVVDVVGEGILPAAYGTCVSPNS